MSDLGCHAERPSDLAVSHLPEGAMRRRGQRRGLAVAAGDRRSFVGAVALALVALSTAGCAGSPGHSAQLDASAPAMVGPKPLPPPVVAPMPVAAAAAFGPDQPAGTLLRLETLLSHHAVLTINLMRARLRNDPDLAQSAVAAVSKNTDDMTAVVQSMAGEQQAGAFKELWSRHINQLFDYARALAANDPAGKDRNRADLATYERDIGTFIATATTGRVSAAAASSALQQHVDDLLGQADAYAAKDYATSYQVERRAYVHMFGVAKTLATGFFAGTPQGAALNVPRVRLQSALGQLLGEHMALAADAMRSAATKAADFAAVGAALNSNTADLTAAMGVLFGPPSATMFSGIWGDHVDALVAYSVAVAGQDRAGEDKAKARLTDFESRFAGFLSSGTEGRLTAPELRDAYVMHDNDLVGQAQTYAQRNYSASNDTIFAAYQQMFDVAEQVSIAAGDTVAARLPQGGVATGGGGLALR
jgi:hypothetical protein